MRIIVFTLLTNAVFLSSKRLVKAHYRRVIHGTEDVDSQYPYVVSLEALFAMHRLCTGSLIADTWVLTAAHCLVPRLALIRYGDMTVPREDTRSFSVVLEKLPHPNYSNRVYLQTDQIALNNDIGLVRILKTDMNVLGKISAIDFMSLYGRVVTYAGFGATHSLVTNDDIIKFLDFGSEINLQLGNGVIVTCHRNAYTIPVCPSMCIVPKCVSNHSQFADGDSGGPALINGKIVAVISGSFVSPVGVVVPVSSYLGWIERTVL